MARVSCDIAECEHCARYLQGEGQMSVEGEESDLDELPYSLGIPERLWAKVIAQGSCQGCKASVDGMINVWARCSSEVECQRKVEGIIRRRGPRLEEFREFLVKHPYLGAGHPTGRALIKAIGRMKPSSFGGEWYRCIRERGGVPAPDEFRAPDEKHSSWMRQSTRAFRAFTITARGTPMVATWSSLTVGGLPNPWEPH
jgi:hypothetical protein